MQLVLSCRSCNDFEIHSDCVDNSNSSEAGSYSNQNQQQQPMHILGLPGLCKRQQFEPVRPQVHASTQLHQTQQLVQSTQLCSVAYICDLSCLTPSLDTAALATTKQ